MLIAYYSVIFARLLGYTGKLSETVRPHDMTIITLHLENSRCNSLIISEDFIKIIEL